MGAVEIAATLAVSRRAVRLYPPEHPTHREALRDLVAAVTTSIDVRPLVLNTRDGRLYEGSEVITETSPATRALAEAMEARRVESLTFHSGFGEIDGEGLSDVLGLRPSPDLQIQEELDARGVRAVTVSELEDNTTRDAEERDRRREADRALYRGALTALNETVQGLNDETPLRHQEIARAVADFIERVSAEPGAIVALATMTGHGEMWKFRAVAAMLYSLVVGRLLGLSDQELLSLGTAALLHDVGGVLTSEGAPPASAADHPAAGARALGGLPDAEGTAVLVAFEHHMGVDGTGWPARPAEHAMHPYSRIVAIAERYDLLIRPDSGTPLTPDKAVAQLLSEATDGPYDPALARLFVLSIGILPIGCFVRLSDHSVGVVRAPGEDPMRPELRVILAPDGTAMRPTLDVDMFEDERMIVEVVPAELLDMATSDYL